MEKQELEHHFRVETENFKRGNWCDGTHVYIFDGDKKIGQYDRNYHTNFHCFHPFKRGDQWYALYSRNYEYTRVMTLPDCIDIGGEEEEEEDGGGFCPVDYHIPIVEVVEYENDVRLSKGWEYAEWALVSGCIWGDDCDWQVEHLDISEAHNGTLQYTGILGYVHLPRKFERVSECVDDNRRLIKGDKFVKLVTMSDINLETGEKG